MLKIGNIAYKRQLKTIYYFLSFSFFKPALINCIELNPTAEKINIVMPIKIPTVTGEISNSPKATRKFKVV